MIGRESNRDAVGARIRLVSGSGRTQHGHVTTAGSYLSASDPRVHFGLDGDAAVRLIEIQWPNGKSQRLTEGLKINRVVRITED